MTSQTTTSIAPRSTLRRFAYATLAALLFTTIVFEAFTHGTGYWQIAGIPRRPRPRDRLRIEGP